MKVVLVEADIGTEIHLLSAILDVGQPTIKSRRFLAHLSTE